MSTDRRRSGERMPVLREFSHGGAAVRPDGAGGWELLVIRPRGSQATALPKGGAEARETGAETAAREIAEETGIVVEVRDRLGEIHYWYRRHGHRVRKTVEWFLCEYRSGEPAAQQEEVDAAWWIPLADAPRRLSYPGERQMIERAVSKLTNG
jgi:8-oxo-dGTP pyrophosphatase MutT (NUDIX family)